MATKKEHFHLDKWFLDFVSDAGEAMIFYAAKLNWRGLEVGYTSWLHQSEALGVKHRSRMQKIHMPEQTDRQITWEDDRFGVKGTWDPLASPLQARLFDSEKGYLDWNCFQPASRVKLNIDGKILEGRGYAEQLILTAAPWHIPMQELRWGRFGSDSDQMVWIELRDEEKKQWLWHNEERIEGVIIEDDHLLLPEKNIKLTLDRSVVLESEKKILHVVRNLVRYLPGFNKSMPLLFLMADEYKWLSKGKLFQQDMPQSEGWAIHEFVNFNPPQK
jgi:hypothetical protein